MSSNKDFAFEVYNKISVREKKTVIVEGDNIEDANKKMVQLLETFSFADLPFLEIHTDVDNSEPISIAKNDGQATVECNTWDKDGNNYMLRDNVEGLKGEHPVYKLARALNDMIEDDYSLCEENDLFNVASELRKFLSRNS